MDSSAKERRTMKKLIVLLLLVAVGVIAVKMMSGHEAQEHS